MVGNDGVRRQNILFQAGFCRESKDGTKMRGGEPGGGCTEEESLASWDFVKREKQEDATLTESKVTITPFS